ncbi:hypothetical protein RvY_01902-2 [Ramazzottius varieornatus]|uniref:Inner centromere protein ARK-binding domain-containing protein n=1 Tax=Ramazzottius varieornatus TaxID=947166 RepID=A0A1D1ULR5_RAMVA|nr:hypothetical protein RvY_01902-2 [Ramazzottius varieornatus]
MIVEEGREAASREEGQIFEEATWNENAFPSISPILFCVFVFVLVSVFCTSLILTYYPIQAQIVGIPETVEVPLQDQPQHDVLPEPVLVKVESEETAVKDMMKNNVEPEEVHSAETASSRGGSEIEVRSSQNAVTVRTDPVSVILHTHRTGDVQLDSESYIREFHSDSDTDDEEKPHRPVPEWSKTPNLTAALGKQLAQEINHDEVFKGVGRLKKKPSLGSFVISARLPRCSADWTCSPLPLGTCKSAWPATEEIAGENEENFDQMVPVTESATGSATGSTDGKHQKPFQLFQREESSKTATGKQTDRPLQQQEVPSRLRGSIRNSMERGMRVA